MNAIEKSFGFTLYAPRDIELTTAIKPHPVHESQALWLACMQCGSCHASCSMPEGRVNLRSAIVYLQKGLVDDAQKATQQCLFCGKCTFVCPRGLSTRHIIAAINQQRC